MEDYIEIIIYAVIVLGSLAGKLYKNQQKKKAETDRQVIREQNQDHEVEAPKHEKPFPGFPTILEEFFELETKQAEPEYTEISETPEEESLDQIPEEEGHAVFESAEKTLISDDLDNSEELKEEPTEEELAFGKYLQVDEASFEFDPVKAVIYSEILGTKKY